MVIKYHDLLHDDLVIVEDVKFITVGEKGLTYKTIGGNYCYVLSYQWASMIQIYESTKSR